MLSKTVLMGTVRIVYATKGDPKFMKHAAFIGDAAFIRKYPDITRRVVNQIVLAAKWISDYAANPPPCFSYGPSRVCRSPLTRRAASDSR
jgi:ABC-type nitrate/sulfonate/bicarbonate transport system substrate-binding protein